MFSVKQVTEMGEMIWPNVTHVSANPGPSTGPCTFVYCQFGESGGNMEFRAGPGEQTIYVMNDNGATVARYNLGGRVIGVAGQPLATATAEQPSALAA